MTVTTVTAVRNAVEGVMMMKVTVAAKGKQGRKGGDSRKGVTILR